MSSGSYFSLPSVSATFSNMTVYAAVGNFCHNWGDSETKSHGKPKYNHIYYFSIWSRIMIFHISTTIEEFQWRRPTGRPHNESQVLCCGLLRKWPHFRQSYGDARRKRRDSLFQNKISMLFNSTSITGFSTPKVGKKDNVWELSERC